MSWCIILITMLIDVIKTLFYETLSYFVPEKIEYEIVGECNKCGVCCRNIYSLDTYTPKEFRFMQFIYPPYRRFYIKGKDEDGNFIFACKYIGDDGLCTVYNKRPRLCRSYPKKKLNHFANLPDGCGYRVIKKDFKDYLK